MKSAAHSSVDPIASRPRFSLIPQAWRSNWHQWWLQRLPAQDQLTLTHRNVYILPTPSGWMLAATLLILLLASINYQLNLGYLLTFLLAGAASAGMWAGHATLRGVQFQLRMPSPVFAGQPCSVQVTLHNPSSQPRHGIGVMLDAPMHASFSSTQATDWSWIELPAQAHTLVHLSFQPEQRGWQPVPLLRAETRFPFGSFRCWALWRPATPVLVYPRPEALPPPLPPSQPHAGGQSLARSQQPGDFDGVRSYRRGDPLQQVLWKKAAQAMAAGSDHLVSREQQSLQPHSLWLDASTTGTIGLEAQASRLTAWVLEAEQQGMDYGLQLPGVRIAPSHGSAHRARCLEALALW